VDVQKQNQKDKEEIDKMPLTKKGREAKENFEERYGKEQGERIFYSYMNKYPKKTKTWERKQ